MTPIRSLLLLFICAGLWLGSQPPATATGEPVGQAAVGPPAMSVGQAAILGASRD